MAHLLQAYPILRETFFNTHVTIACALEETKHGPFDYLRCVWWPKELLGSGEKTIEIRHLPGEVPGLGTLVEDYQFDKS